MDDFSIVIPCKNESSSIESVVKEIKELYPAAELIVVNDGSTDDTSDILSKYELIQIKHPYSKGNGAAIKSGARAASKEVIVFMDGDGQHSPRDIGSLLDELEKGYDLVVGARGKQSQSNFARLVANSIYNKLSSWMVGYKIKDLTSGFRAVKAEPFRRFLYLLPNGFSYPTTSTMAFFRAGFSVSYVPIKVSKREGKSHISYLKDGARFLLIIFKVASLYSPLKLFTPISILFFLLGLIRYAYTFVDSGEFTNMSALLLTSSVLVFLIGIVSEQITVLMYQRSAGAELRSTNTEKG